MGLACEAALAGFAVLPCWWDWQIATRADLPMSWFKNTTIAWMRVAEAILLAPGWEQSEGVRAELAIAHELGIPVFTSLDALIQWREREDALEAERWTEDDEDEFTGFPILTGELKRLEPVPLTTDEQRMVIESLDGRMYDTYCAANALTDKFINDPTIDVIDRVIELCEGRRDLGQRPDNGSDVHDDHDDDIDTSTTTEEE